MADYDQQSIINGLLPPPTNPAVSLSQGFLAGAKKAPGAVADALGLPDALKALRGQMTEGEQENLARDAVTGLIPFGKGLSAGAAKAIFAGPLALTADKKALAQAMDMASDRVKGGLGDVRRMPSSIWHETGWFQGADGKWRHEIPDTEAQMKAGFDIRNVGGKIRHPEMFEAYPDLAGIKLRYSEPHGAGSYMKKIPGSNPEEIIALPHTAQGSVNNSYSDNPHAFKGVMLHELQHAIQEREGFVKGTNPAYERTRLPENTGNPIIEQFRSAVATGKYGVPGDPTFMDAARRLLQLEREVNTQRASEAYRHNAGEVEARNVQNRMFMAPKQLERIPPFWSEDVPRKDQIIPKPIPPGQWQLMQALQGK